MQNYYDRMVNLREKEIITPQEQLDRSDDEEVLEYMKKKYYYQSNRKMPKLYNIDGILLPTF